MRIIHVAQFLGIGGLEKIIYHLAHEQQNRGHSVQIYIYDHERTWVDYFIKSGLQVITPVLKKDGYDLSLLKRMNEDLFLADIIHGHDLNPLMYLGPLTLWKRLTFQKRPKLIHTTHGLDHIENYPRGKLYQHIFSRLADKIIGVSEKIGKFYLEDIKLSPNKIVVIPNGIQTYKKTIDHKLRYNQKLWIAKRHGLDIHRPIILSLSRIVPLKDQGFLITALKQRPQYQLIIAGPASDQNYYDQLKTLEDENILLIGPQDQVSEYNMGADLYVSASTHEGIPVAVLEAMAVETPCLVSEIPGHLTLLTNGSYIETFPIGKAEIFLEKLDLILNASEKFHQNAILARKQVEQYYSVNKMVDEYLQVYES
ncbi:MAG: glycosyltransferase family 4 protein [Bacteriovorax sp.]|nr:glycosyltransferase family 4 protein [Bacteriovorax sp.]